MTQLTKVSFPHGYGEMIEYLRLQFMPTLPGQAFAVIALPKGAPFSTMSGGRLTVVTADNFETALQEIDANYHEFAGATVYPERLYLAFGRVDLSYLADLRDGVRQPDSLESCIISKLLPGRI